MYGIFKTVLIMSTFGFCLIALLLLLKPATAKKFPAKWQYYAWVMVVFCMLIPFWKIIPKNAGIKFNIEKQNNQVSVQQENAAADETKTIIIESIPIEYRKIALSPLKDIGVLELIALVWILGMCAFLFIAMSSYILFLSRKRNNSIAIEHSAALEHVKKELRIKRNIRIRMSPGVKSPILVGIFFPIVYIPCTEITNDRLKMIFLHELTHYKRKDLMIKWLSLFVNAVHWFNPLVYMLCENIIESSEISCDMEVTKNMDKDGQDFYMRTILELL